MDEHEFEKMLSDVKKMTKEQREEARAALLAIDPTCGDPVPKVSTRRPKSHQHNRSWTVYAIDYHSSTIFNGSMCLAQFVNSPGQYQTITILYDVSMPTPKAEVARSNRVGSAKEYKGLAEMLTPFPCPKPLSTVSTVLKDVLENAQHPRGLCAASVFP